MPGAIGRGYNGAQDTSGKVGQNIALSFEGINDLIFHGGVYAFKIVMDFRAFARMDEPQRVLRFRAVR